MDSPQAGSLDSYPILIPTQSLSEVRHLECVQVPTPPNYLFRIFTPKGHKALSLPCILNDHGGDLGEPNENFLSSFSMQLIPRTVICCWNQEGSAVGLACQEGKLVATIPRSWHTGPDFTVFTVRLRYSDFNPVCSETSLVRVLCSPWLQYKNNRKSISECLDEK